jgi:hypothetical protein
MGIWKRQGSRDRVAHLPIFWLTSEIVVRGVRLAHSDYSCRVITYLTPTWWETQTSGSCCYFALLIETISLFSPFFLFTWSSAHFPQISFHVHERAQEPTLPSSGLGEAIQGDAERRSEGACSWWPRQSCQLRVPALCVRLGCSDSKGWKGD